jgi:hypothetical protein
LGALYFCSDESLPFYEFHVSRLSKATFMLYIVIKNVILLKKMFYKHWIFFPIPFLGLKDPKEAPKEAKKCQFLFFIKF